MAKKKPAKKPAKKVAKKAAKKAMKKAAPKKVAKKTAKKVVAKPAKKKPAKKAARPASNKPAAPAAAEVVKKTTVINPYLTFKDNCEEAFNFYKSVFGGEFGYVGRFKEMPPQEDGKPISESEGNLIMHISLQVSKETVLMGSDCPEPYRSSIVFGSNFSISITTVSKAEADRFFNSLSAGGTITMPIANTFWGSYFGMFTDKFGINWMVSFDQSQQG